MTILEFPFFFFSGEFFEFWVGFAGLAVANRGGVQEFLTVRSAKNGIGKVRNLWSERRFGRQQ